MELINDLQFGRTQASVEWYLKQELETRGVELENGIPWQEIISGLLTEMVGRLREELNDDLWAFYDAHQDEVVELFGKKLEYKIKILVFSKTIRIKWKKLRMVFVILVGERPADA
jgi:hypothetical protein